MSFNPDLKQGCIISNKDLCNIFKCAPQGGMRKSNKTDSLVLISDRTRGVYKDRWREDILHYTGMGLTGNQRLNYSQNRTLANSKNSGISLFLFEVFQQGRYFYQGRVLLAANPYQEKQLDKNGHLRNVWVFSLKIVGKDEPIAVDEKQIRINIQNRERKIVKLSDKEITKRAKIAHKKPGVRESKNRIYERNEYVAEEAKRKAKGRCHLCGEEAPFKNKQGTPYLETHHIEWLSEGGEDTIGNTVALCPNCHRKMHILNLKIDKKILKQKNNSK